MDRENKIIVFSIIGAIVAFILFITIWCSYVIIPTGFVGIHTRFGKVIGEKSAGLNWKIPYIDRIVEMSIREQTIQQVYSVSSKDMQTIQMSLNVQYSIAENPGEIFVKFNENYEERLIMPRIAESLNAVAARYTIEEFITKRNAMSDELMKEISEDVNEYKVRISACSIIEHDFSDEFDRAIEAKLVASQNALTAANNLEKVRYEAEAEVVKAQKTAEANKLLQQSLTPLLIQKMTIEKWNGVLPTATGGDAIPLLNIK